uniref:ADNP homeobox 2 n=1 Tax=Bos mutus grunniens TaxID=30521 RepID=A0A8B9YN55_BOSMU
MFQIPVENLDNIRKVRKKVKSILVDIGLDSCKELLKDLKGFDPGEKYFYNTSWGDISLWEPSGKKVAAKASGGDGIPDELFQILKDDAVKVLHSICQQIWKTQQWPQDWKRSVFIPISKKGNAKECSNYRTTALISHASKVMLKILQARLQQYVNRELHDVQAGFRKGRGTRDQIANIRWIMEKATEFQTNIYFCFIDYAKAFDCVDHNKLWKILKEMGIPDYLTCLLRNLYAGQEATVRTGHGTTDWFQIGKGVRQGCILSPCLFNLYAEYIMRNTGLKEAQAGIKIARRNINNLRYADDTTFVAESEEELNSLLMKVKEESEKVGLKLNIQKMKIMASGPITSQEIDGETVETVSDFIFWAPKSLQMVTAAMKLKDTYSLEGKL